MPIQIGGRSMNLSLDSYTIETKEISFTVQPSRTNKTHTAQEFRKKLQHSVQGYRVEGVL